VVLPDYLGGGPIVSGHGDILLLLEPMEALAPAIEEARAESDLVIVLAHVGYEMALAMAPAMEGVDIVIAAHDGELHAAPVPAGEAVVSAPGPDGEFLARLDVFFDEDGSIEEITGTPVDLDQNMPEDPALLELYIEYLARVEDAVEQILASIPENVPRRGGSYVGADACAGCHEVEAHNWAGTHHASAFDIIRELNQDYNVECIRCHVTGFGYLGGFRLETVTPAMADVQCESCHGAGADHVAEPLLPYGGPVPEPICRTCHEASRFPDWDYATKLPLVTCNN